MRRSRLVHLTAVVGHDPDVNGDWQLVLWLTGTGRSWFAGAVNEFLRRRWP